MPISTMRSRNATTCSTQSARPDYARSSRFKSLRIAITGIGICCVKASQRAWHRLCCLFGRGVEMSKVNVKRDCSKLCYLEASRIAGPAGDLAGLTVQTHGDETLGKLNGVLINPSQRRLL